MGDLYVVLGIAMVMWMIDSSTDRIIREIRLTRIGK